MVDIVHPDWHDFLALYDTLKSLKIVLSYHFIVLNAVGDSGYVSLLKNNLSLPSDKTRIQGTIVVYNIAMKPH